MTARQVFDVFTETCLKGSVRSTAKIEKDMKNTRQGPNETVAQHISNMCTYFRTLHLIGSPLNDSRKVVETSTTMNEKWWRIADDYLAMQPDDISFDKFRMKMVQLEQDASLHDSNTVQTSCVCC
jgi:hypothetical protein